MFSGILLVSNDEEWMRTRKATLTLDELIKMMGDAFEQTYSPRVPAELTYIMVIGDSSKLKLKASDESGSDSCLRGHRVADTWLSFSTTFKPRIVESVD